MLLQEMIDRPAPPNPIKKNERGRAVRAGIIAMATDLFALRGYVGVSIAEIAKAASVTKPTVLYHFPDKETLWRTCVDELWAEVDQHFRINLPPEPAPTREFLRALLHLFVDALLRWPAYCRIPFIEGATPSWRSDHLVDKHFGPHVLQFNRTIISCQKRGLIKPGREVHIQSVLTSSVNVFVSQGAMWNRVTNDNVADPQYLREFVDTAIDLVFL